MVQAELPGDDDLPQPQGLAALEFFHVVLVNAPQRPATLAVADFQLLLHPGELSDIPGHLRRQERLALAKLQVRQLLRIFTHASKASAEAALSHATASG